MRLTLAAWAAVEVLVGRQSVALAFAEVSPRPLGAWPLAWPSPSGPLGWQRSPWWLRSLAMITEGDGPRDLSRLVLPLGGSLEATGDLFEPFRLVDVDGVVVVPAAEFFRELAACGRPAATHRSYGMVLLRWWRPAGGRGWLGSGDPGGGPGFCSWIQLAGKPAWPHWRYPGGGAPGAVRRGQRPGRRTR